MKIDVLKTIKSNFLYKKSQIEELKAAILEYSSVGSQELLVLDFSEIDWIKKKLYNELSKFVDYFRDLPSSPSIYYDFFDDTLILTKKEIKEKEKTFLKEWYYDNSVKSN